MLNRVTLIGNLGADPEVRYMPAGGAVTTIRLATTRRWKDRQTGERKDATEWHRVVFFSPLAEIAGEYLKKGGQTYVAGRLQTRKWQDKEGHERYTTEIIAEEMYMLGSRSGGTGNFSEPAQASHQAPPHQPSGELPHAAPSSPSVAASFMPPPPSFDDFDDDIPF